MKKKERRKNRKKEAEEKKNKISLGEYLLVVPMVENEGENLLEAP